MDTRPVNRSLTDHAHGGSKMPMSHTRRHRLAAVATVAAIGLCVNGLAADASGSRHVQSLGSPLATPTAALANATPATCVTTGCDLYAHAGTVSAGSSGLIPVWGFSFNPAAGTGELGGSVNNTIIISETDTLTLTLHNDLPAGAGALSLEVPAAQVVPDSVGAAEAATQTYTFGPLDPGTYVYQAGSTIEQPRQLAMGLAAIIIVRPSDFGTAKSAYGGGDGAFEDEALVVMNEIDPDFNLAPLASDVEDYAPELFLVNGQAHPNTADIAANPGDRVLMHAANLGIRDRALGLLNLRMDVIGDDSHKVNFNLRAGVESKLLTPGQVSDITTTVTPSAPIGTQFAVLDLSRHLNNGGDSGVGGMLTFIDVVSGPVAAGGAVAKVTNLAPVLNDGLQDITVAVTFSGGTTSAKWFLDAISGPGHAFAAGDGSTTVPVSIAAVIADGAMTGDHVIWIQPLTGVVAGTPSGDVFTLAREGPSAFALTTDPHFANLTFNKVALNPPGSTDVIITGSAQPSLLDYSIDQAQGCFTLPAPAGSCPSPITLTPGAPILPSHTQSLNGTITVASIPALGVNTIYARAHEISSAAGAARWGAWDAAASVEVVKDTEGPSVAVDLVNTATVAGIGNHPGNLNFLESIRVQIDITDTLSPIADAELFLDTNTDPAGSGAQLRPLAGQWLDDLDARTRTAYVEIPVSELQARPQGNVSIYIHAKDAAGNWGAYTLYTLPLDKTNPVITSTPVDGAHVYDMVDENGAPILAGGSISLNACDPNGVSPVLTCPAGIGSPPATNPVSSGIVEVRYHVSAVTGTIGAAGAGIFYQDAQRTFGTITDNGNGTSHVVFNWHLIQPSAVPPDAASSVWVWVVDGAGNPSVPVEVVLGP